MEFQRKVVLITGCGSGLGRALTRLLVDSERFRVIATTRTVKSAEELRREFMPSPHLWIEPLDITQDDSRVRLVSKILARWKKIDVLINNAGVSYRSVIEHMDETSEMHQLDVNYLSPLALIRLVIPAMRENRSGHIVNISSVSGMMAMPTMASYSASKHALEGATEALWYELKPYGISVSLVQPGFIRSDSFEHVLMPPKARLSRDLAGPYSEMYAHMEPFIRRLMHLSPATPDSISKKILSLIEQKRPALWQPVTPDAVVFFWLRKLSPRRLFHRLMFFLLPQARRWGRPSPDVHAPPSAPLPLSWPHRPSPFNESMNWIERGPQ